MNQKPYNMYQTIFKTEEMCKEAVCRDPWSLYDVPDYFKTQKMCDDVVWKSPYSLQFVHDWFVTQEQLKIWYDEDDYYDDDKCIECFNGNQKQKAQKTSTKEGLLPIA